MGHHVASYNLTLHAKVRANQRGVSDRRLLSLLVIADIAVPVGRDLHAHRVSRGALAEAIAEGLSPSDADRLSNIAVVEADNGAIVTVAPVHGRKGRHYRRRSRRHWMEAQP